MVDKNVTRVGQFWQMQCSIWFTMNANQENHRSSYYSLDGVLRQNENVWQSNPAFATSVADFRSDVKTIDSLV